MLDFIGTLFLGMFGFHKFKSGKIGMGILYLFTYGLCGIGWLIDVIKAFKKMISEEKGEIVIVKREDVEIYNLTDTTMPSSYVVFDLETTGLDPKVNEIIEIGAIRYKDGVEIERFHSYIKPNVSIPRFITELTGITNNMVRTAPRINEALIKFINFIGNDTLVAHNALFDLKFVSIFCKAYNLSFTNKKIDTLQLARVCVNTENHKLETIKKYFGINVSSHNALDDCVVTHTLYEFCKQKGAVPKLSSRDKQILIKEEYLKPIKYDEIDDDIWWCYIDSRNGMCDAIGSWDNFEKVEKKLSELCTYNGGKLYKSRAKGARYAILFSPFKRSASYISELQEKGYKVVSFESVLKYLGITDMWDIDNLERFIEEHRRSILNE